MRAFSAPLGGVAVGADDVFTTRKTDRGRDRSLIADQVESKREGREGGRRQRQLLITPPSVRIQRFRVREELSCVIGPFGQ